MVKLMRRKTDWMEFRWRLLVARIIIFVHKVALSIGRRGTALIVFGLLFVGQGYAFLVDPPFPRTTETSNFEMMLQIMPWSGWAIIWIFTGVAAIIQGFNHSEDRLAFTLLEGLSLFWAGGLLVGYARGGDYRWLGAITWVAATVLIHLIAGWPEHQGLRQQRRIWR
jgi:hypothetical protein